MEHKCLKIHGIYLIYVGIRRGYTYSSPWYEVSEPRAFRTMVSLFYCGLQNEYGMKTTDYSYKTWKTFQVAHMLSMVRGQRGGRRRTPQGQPDALILTTSRRAAANMSSLLAKSFPGQCRLQSGSQFVITRAEARRTGRLL